VTTYSYGTYRGLIRPVIGFCPKFEAGLRQDGVAGSVSNFLPEKIDIHLASRVATSCHLLSTTMVETGIEIDEKKSRSGSGSGKKTSVEGGEKSPGFFGKKNKNILVDTVPPTPSTVVGGDDDSSVGSSVSGGSGKKKKKPRAEYQKQIDALQEEKELLQKESETFKEKFAILKNWAMNPPLPGSSQKKTLDFDAVAAEVSEPEAPAVVPPSRGRFRKKPRAEYQAEIDALLVVTNSLKDEINLIKHDMKAIKEWSKKCPV